MQKLQIDASTWSTLNRLLDEALDKPAAQLPQWLDELAPEFEGLKPRLRDLLSRTGLIETGEFLHTLPKFELEPDDLAAASGEHAGQEIGPYRLVRELGSGGMGVVWMAERTDGLIDRPVALKLPHGAWKRAGLAERMARERSILATLAHPNIAHLYDAGITADGQPYLAIEYVEGRRIDYFCDEQSMDVKARLRLFAQVADAVAYAHAKLVVHRDLKPANILVSAGRVKLLDFGIAKLLEDGEARETRVTELSGRALTPDYASPEQLRGEPLTIASDVYSLGVVLYELLCGQRPYKLAHDSRGALEDAILQAEPPAPSGVVPSARRRELRGDLDTIVLKALKKKPGERYATVHALADDIGRFLDGHPVLARPDSWTYRTSRLLRRHRLVFSASTAVAVVLVGATLYSMRQAQLARTEELRAGQVEQFIASILTDTQSAESPTAEGLLKQARARIGDEFADHPLTQIRLLLIVSRSLIGFSEYDAADEALDAALSISRDHPDAADSYVRQARVQRLSLHRFRGRLVQLRQELPALRSEMDRDGNWSPADRVKLLIEAAYSANLDALDERAAVDIQTAADLALRELGPRHELTLEAASARSAILRGANRYDEAIAAAEQALALMISAYAPNLYHRRILDARMALGTSYLSKGRIHDAVRELGTVIDHAGDRDFLELYAQVHITRAWVSGGEPQAALRALARAESLALDSNNADTVILSQAMALRAYVLASMGEMSPALQVIDEALKRYGREHARDHPPTLAFRALRAMILAHLARIGEARAELEEISGLNEISGKKSSILHWTLPHLSYAKGVVERLAGNCDLALTLQQEALQSIRADPGTWLKRARILGEIGLCAPAGQKARAVTSLDQALSLLREHQTSGTSSDRFTLELQAKLASLTH
ncbi:MAG TPA: serine/threonine-protein kinase [Steroidobacteraceae bacterium]|nr:serine/threonine-protein kinase [Steroidobacteraceae bacterium]